jgi:hypothetical protein
VTENCLGDRAQRKFHELPMPTQFRKLFRGWVNGEVNFIEIID